MDTRPLSAPQAPAASVHTLRFDGSASEYFRIWIVNTALTIVTFGIFSAWAKVRSKRYLYGNTYIGAHAFDYHASPLRILLGRAIALALLLGYSLTAAFAPVAVFGWIILFLLAFPWLIKSSLRFAARNTSYRNVRFDFHGTYGGALKAYLLWQILAVITLFIALPFSHRARDYYHINNHSYGQAQFRTEISAKRLYLIYLWAPLLAIVAAIPLSAIAGYLFATTPHANRAGDVAIQAFQVFAVGYWYIVGLLMIPAFIGAMTFNLAIGNLKLGDAFRFESKLSPAWMTWIVVSNLAVTVCTLGLLYPWTRIRRARYMASCISVSGPGDVTEFQSAPLSAGGAIGEEVASFFDLDFGL